MFELNLTISTSLYGDSEALLGKWFKRTGKRDQIFLSTKFGYVKGAQLGNIDSSAAYAKSACEESLKILGIDYIDLCKSWMRHPLMTLSPKNLSSDTL